MRVIYLVRGAQLLLTLHALWMLYSVSSFCEKTALSLNQCPNNLRHIRPATEDEIADLLRRRELRAASNTTSNATSPSSNSTTTDQAPTTSESSTVTSSTEEIKIRKKRDESRELPDNGMTEGQRKASETKVEVKKAEEKKVEVTTTPIPTTQVMEKKEGKKEEQNPEPSIVKKSEEKRELKKEDTTTVVTTTTTTVPTTVSKNDEKKEHIGAKVEIPFAPEASKEVHHEDPKIDNKTDHANFSSSENETRPHTVKKDLKTHVQESVDLEEKVEEVASRVLTIDQQRFVLEHSDAFLQEVRCLEVTSDDYFSKQLSPFSEHLKGLAFIGPVLVVIAIYLVCTVLRTRLGNENPTEFLDTLGRIFHIGMWTLVSMTFAYIARYWTENWNSASNNTFLPEFPCAWYSLALLASFMSLAASIEMWFHKRLYYDVILERSYRCYEVIENSEDVLNQVHRSRTNVY